MSNAGELFIGASLDQQQTEDTNPNLEQNISKRNILRSALASALGVSILLAGCGGEKDEKASDTPAAAAEATPTSTRSKIIFPSDKPRPEETNHQVPNTTDNRPQPTQNRPSVVPTFEDNAWGYQDLEKYKNQPGVFNRNDAIAALRKHGYKDRVYEKGLEVTPAHVLKTGNTLVEKEDQFVANGTINGSDVKGIKGDCKVSLTGQRVVPGSDVSVVSVNIPNPRNRADDTQIYTGRVDVKTLQKDKRVVEACNAQ